MKKVGLFYNTEAVNTGTIGRKIKDAFGSAKIDIIPVEEAWKKDFEKYDHIIVGLSTWFDGEIPSYWDELRPELESLDMKGKKIAIFGLGDQVKYAENFVDGIGILAGIFETAGAKIIGFTSIEGYSFEVSRALRNGRFMGLAIDLENQPEKTDERIKNWTEQLKKEFSMK